MVLEVYSKKIYSQSKIDRFFSEVVFENKKYLKNKPKKTIIRYRRRKNIMKSSYWRRLMSGNFSNKIKMSLTMNKPQKKLFKYLFLEAKNAYEEDKSTIEFTLEIKKIFRYLNVRYNIIEIFEFEKNLEKILENKIIYTVISADNTEIMRGRFNLLCSYSIQQDILSYVFPKEIMESTEQENYFSALDFLVSIELELERSLVLYKELGRNLDAGKRKNSVEIGLEKYKELMDAADIYKRMYDLEKKIIEPTLKDINNYSQYFISVDKIKENDNPKSKVKSLVFHIYSKEDNEKIQHLLNMFPADLRHKNNIREKTEDFYFREGYDFVYKVIKYSREKHGHLLLEDMFFKTLDEIYVENKEETEGFILYEEIKNGLEKFSKFKNRMGRILLQTRFELPVLLDILNTLAIEKNLKYENKYYKITACYSEDPAKRFIKIYKNTKK